jgi:outer membrane protein assembly factor BamB
VQSLEERALLAASIWTQKAADAGHTSYVDTTVAASSIAESWTKTGLTGLADVAIDQDHIYRTATKPGGVGVQYTFEVQALRLSDGGLVWSRAIPWAGEGVSAPSVFDGRVYVSASGHSGSSSIWPTL